jgi:dipeptidase E
MASLPHGLAFRPERFTPGPLWVAGRASRRHDAGMRERHIVAMGGGGLLAEDGKFASFILGLTGVDRPKVCFVPTASGDSDSYVARFYRAFAGKAEATDLPLFPWPPQDLRDLVLGQDVIDVGGGSTANLLALWRLHGLDTLVREAWEAGVVLSGVSAGANCWFDACVTDSFGPALDGLRDGLGFLEGSFCPHYDSEPERRPVFTRLVGDGFPAGVACDDAAAAHFVGTELREIVVSDAGARAFRVIAGRDGADETPLETRLL